MQCQSQLSLQLNSITRCAKINFLCNWIALQTVRRKSPYILRNAQVILHNQYLFQKSVSLQILNAPFQDQAFLQSFSEINFDCHTNLYRTINYHKHAFPCNWILQTVPKETSIVTWPYFTNSKYPSKINSNAKIRSPCKNKKGQQLNYSTFATLINKS